MLICTCGDIVFAIYSCHLLYKLPLEHHSFVNLFDHSFTLRLVSMSDGFRVQVYSLFWSSRVLCLFTLCRLLCHLSSQGWKEEASFSQWEEGRSCTSSTLPTPQEGPLVSHCERTHCCRKTWAASGTWTGPWLVAAGFLLQTGLTQWFAFQGAWTAIVSSCPFPLIFLLFCVMA